MATISNELFLFVCVKHANGGKINFAEVGKECGLKQTAAYMRWSRFKDKLDTSPLNQAAGAANGDQSDDEAAVAGMPKKTPKKASKKKPSKKQGDNATPKKRKLNENGDGEGELAEIKEEEDWELVSAHD